MIPFHFACSDRLGDHPHIPAPKTGRFIRISSDRRVTMLFLFNESIFKSAETSVEVLAVWNDAAGLLGFRPWMEQRSAWVSIKRQSMPAARIIVHQNEFNTCERRIGVAAASRRQKSICTAPGRSESPGMARQGGGARKHDWKIFDLYGRALAMTLPTGRWRYYDGMLAGNVSGYGTYRGPRSPYYGHKSRTLGKCLRTLWGSRVIRMRSETAACAR
jgi:hypothetical protein